MPSRAPRDPPQEQRSSTPTDLPNSVPPDYRAAQHDWSIQILMGIQQNIGSLQTSINTLGKNFERLETQVEKHVRLQHMIWSFFIACGILLTIFWNVFGDNFKISFSAQENTQSTTTSAGHNH